MLDIDDRLPSSARDWNIENVASRISHRWDLGDCLIVLSSFDGEYLNYHLVYDRILPWLQIYGIVRQLAKEGKIDRNLARLSEGRGDLTLRLSPDRANGRMAPFPIGYVIGCRVRKRYHGGGIKKWLEAWKTAAFASSEPKVAKKISFISESPSQIARIASE